MVFARRSPRSFSGKIIEAVWPSAGFKRTAVYFARRVIRLRATPHAIGAGFASGAAMSCFPLIGLHFGLSFALAWLLRGNILAAALGTAVGNPLTFPILFSLAYSLGALMRGEIGADSGEVDVAGSELASEGLFSGSLKHAWPLFATTMVGATPIALATFATFYLIVRWSAARFQAMRRARIATRAPGGGVA